MSEEKKRYRFFLTRPFSLPSHPKGLPKEELLPLWRYNLVKHLLEDKDVEWDFHPGALASYGDWSVENREEALLAGAARLSVVREACESGKYNAIILMGGIDPGFLECREIARKYHIPVTSNCHSQMHIASMLGTRFTIIDINEEINMILDNLVVQYRFAHQCASIRSINLPLPRPGYVDEISLSEEREKAERGEPSVAVERAVQEAVAAIEEDSAQVIMFGCSITYWLRPYVQKRLDEMGWEIPVLEGMSCSIELAKAMVNLGIDASGLCFPSDRPQQWRRRKII